MFLDGLDALDRAILEQLIENARMSYSQIASRTGISRVAVQKRVQALEARGIIEEYTVVLNPQKISGAVSCYFELEFAPASLQAATEILNACATVTQIYRVTGGSRLHVHAVAAGADEMEELITTVIDRLPGLTGCSCSTILSRIKDVKGLRL